MATITSSDIITILQTGTYPYTLRYFQRRQRDTIYPSVEVVKTSSDSTSVDVQRTQTDQVFEIKLYIKYVRKDETEEADRLVIENEIKSVLESSNLEPPNKIFLEQKQWSHQVIDSEVFGSVSTLRLSVRDITSTTGSGLVGAGDIFELDSAGSATQIDILAINDRDGLTTDSHINDTGVNIYDPIHSEAHLITITYESTTALDSLIQTASYNRDEINCKIIRGGTTTKYTFLIGETTKSGAYDQVERATTNLYVVGLWV